MKFRIALAQIDPAVGNLEHNVREHIRMIDRAREAHADLVVFPELSLTGYGIKDLNWDLAFRPDTPPAVLEPLLQTKNNPACIIGGVEESESFGIYNSAFLLDQGRLATVHRKVYPPTYGMFEELRYFSAGTRVRAFDSRFGRLGVLICEDLWHPSIPYLLTLDGARVIIALVASPTRLGGDTEELRSLEINRGNHQAYARLLSVYVVFCNRVGFEDGVNFWGGSSVIGPGGEMIAEAKAFEEDLVVADIDDEQIRRARRFSRHMLDENPQLTLQELQRITQLR